MYVHERTPSRSAREIASGGMKLRGDCVCVITRLLSVDKASFLCSLLVWQATREKKKESVVFVFLVKFMNVSVQSILGNPYLLFPTSWQLSLSFDRKLCIQMKQKW